MSDLTIKDIGDALKATIKGAEQQLVNLAKKEAEGKEVLAKGGKGLKNQKNKFAMKARFVKVKQGSKTITIDQETGEVSQNKAKAKRPTGLMPAKGKVKKATYDETGQTAVGANMGISNTPGGTGMSSVTLSEKLFTKGELEDTHEVKDNEHGSGVVRYTKLGKMAMPVASIMPDGKGGYSKKGYMTAKAESEMRAVLDKHLGKMEFTGEKIKAEGSGGQIKRMSKSEEDSLESLEKARVKIVMPGEEEPAPVTSQPIQIKPSVANVPNAAAKQAKSPRTAVAPAANTVANVRAKASSRAKAAKVTPAVKAAPAAPSPVASAPAAPAVAAPTPAPTPGPTPISPFPLASDYKPGIAAQYARATLANKPAVPKMSVAEIRQRLADVKHNQAQQAIFAQQGQAPTAATPDIASLAANVKTPIASATPQIPTAGKDFTNTGVAGVPAGLPQTTNEASQLTADKKAAGIGFLQNLISRFKGVGNKTWGTYGGNSTNSLASSQAALARGEADMSKAAMPTAGQASANINKIQAAGTQKVAGQVSGTQLAGGRQLGTGTQLPRMGSFKSVAASPKPIMPSAPGMPSMAGFKSLAGGRATPVPFMRSVDETNEFEELKKGLVFAALIELEGNLQK